MEKNQISSSITLDCKQYEKLVRFTWAKFYSIFVKFIPNMYFDVYFATVSIYYKFRKFLSRYYILNTFVKTNAKSNELLNGLFRVNMRKKSENRSCFFSRDEIQIHVLCMYWVQWTILNSIFQIYNIMIFLSFHLTIDIQDGCVFFHKI